MDNNLISRHWMSYQGSLFDHPDPELVVTQPLQRLIIVFDTIQTDKYMEWMPEPIKGRNRIDREAILRVFIAKAVLDIPETKFMRDRLLNDYTLRRMCGFTSIKRVPCEATFSNAFRDFAESGIVEKIHDDLIRNHLGDTLLEHINRDATAIPAREKAVKKETPPEQPKKKRGRPRKDEQRVKEPSRLELQSSMTIEEMKADLPAFCDYGTKKNAKGVRETWRGYKLHLDVDDRCIPLSFLVTSASTHDSQAAIPLEAMTAQRVASCYSLMDAGYVSTEITKFVESFGKVAVVAPKKPRNGPIVPLDPAKARRFKHRTVVERANARVKDDLAGSGFRFRGLLKVQAHLGLSVLALAAENIARYLI